MDSVNEFHTSNGLSIDPSTGEGFVSCSARIAIYDDLRSAPRTIDIQPMPIQDFINTLASQTYTLAQQAGGKIPYTVIKEIAENLIHADFEEPVVSILDGGNTISFADQGPGIEDKEKVQLPGFTSATSEMKRYILGVGSGLPTVREYLAFSGGHLEIDDNIKDGSVVTITLKENHSELPGQMGGQDTGRIFVGAAPSPSTEPSPYPVYQQPQQATAGTPSAAYPQVPSLQIPPQPLVTPPSLAQTKMMRREDEVMRLFLTYEMIGPSDLRNPPLNLSLGTAARTLDSLEQAGLIVSTASKKRVLTEEGARYLRQSMGTFQ